MRGPLLGPNTGIAREQMWELCLLHAVLNADNFVGEDVHSGCYPMCYQMMASI